MSELQVDCYPLKGQFRSGEAVELALDVDPDRIRSVRISITEEEAVVADTAAWRIECPVDPEQRRQLIRLTAPARAWAGFGVVVRAKLNDGGRAVGRTAFDVVDSWRRAPRYGFVSDFGVTDSTDTPAHLAKYHVVMVQFYDWMYRHHRLLADTEVFEDALGREVSTETVRGKVDCCHRHGMPALAYGAIYGAGWGFHREHPEWGLYDQSGEPVSLGGFLAIMNTSPESPWSAHIVEQYRQAVSRIGFDGIHMDTYGYPKSAYSARGADGQRQLERLEEHVPPLVHRTRAALQAEREDVALVFNCVNNWPAVALLRADTPVDAVYIEVWDPHSRYRHLVDLIRSARCRTDRPIILAAYLKPLEGVATNETGPGPDAPGGTSRLHTAEESLLLLTAVIASAGGYHLILGEADGVLTDPYYVNHAALRPTFAPYVRRYYDFLVQYARLLFDPAAEDLSFTSAHGPDDDFVFTGPPCAPEPVAGSVWVVIHRLDERIALRLVNLCSVDDDIWNADKREPTPVHNLTVRALVTEPVAGVFTASPDDDADPCAPSLIRHQMVPTPKGPALRFTLPTLRRWRVVWIRLA